jgi:hypothetical protein
MKAKTLPPVLCITALLAVLPSTLAAQNAPEPASAEVQALKQQLAEQQKEIDLLKSAIDEQKKILERATGTAPAAASGASGSVAAPASAANPDFNLPSKKLGQVASASPVIPPAPPAPIAAIPKSVMNAAQPPPAAANPCEAPIDTANVPPYLRFGNVCVVPVGFMDATFVARDVNAQSVIGSNFGGIPYNNVLQSRLTEARFSIANSRLGFRVDGNWKGWHFIGYNEFDFLGTSGANNITVTNGAVVPRIRLYWVDARKDKWEFLAGQSWSMLTPNRRGISALPGDIFYSQVFDVNYMAGLTWTRQTGYRALYHPSNTVTIGVSAENPDQYIGGYAGGSAITLPSNLTGLSGTQLDQGNLPFSAPVLTPDFIAKVAFDPSARFHAEVGGVERNFRIANPNSPLTSTKSGGGVLFGMNGEIFKNFRLITTNYWSDGGGRYLFGQAPDLVVNANSTISLLHAGGTVDGFEARMGNWLWYAYYGGIYIGRDTAIDTNGKPVGYGYLGSPNSQNRTIQEATVGFNRTLWGDPRYGAINVMGQYEYLTRNPWFAGTGPSAAHDNTVYIDIRYTLPGSMPYF